MLDTLSRNIIYGRTHYAIEHIGTNEDVSILVLQVKDQKGELNITETVTTSGVEKIKELFPKLKSANLVVNNNQVLQKTVISNSNLADSALLNEAFPNIDLNVFYYEITRGLDKAFIYICRKEYVETLIEDYKTKHIFITQWSLGNSSLDSVIPLLNGQGEINSKSSVVEYADGYINSIKSIQSNEKVHLSYQIESLEVDGNQINALGTVLRSLGGVDEQRSSSNYISTEEVRQSSFKQHRFYEIGLPAAIGILLLIFLVNFLFYNHYYQEVSMLDEIGDANVLQKQLLAKKDSIVVQKQKLFEDVIESSSSSSSFYIDQVIREMPETILLEQLQYHPILKKIRKGKPIVLEDNIISIRGVTRVNNDISSWISTIENMDFTNKISIKNLEKKGSNTLFTIELRIK